MSELDKVYEDAKIVAQEAEKEARREAELMTHEELKAAYITMAGLAAYHGRVERVMFNNPRLHFDALRKLLNQLEATKLIAQAQIAEEQGMEISGLARVSAKPLIELLDRVQTMVNA